MSTKFISKNSNYMVVIKPGIEWNRALGTHAIPGVYVRFVAGVATINDESIVEKMREHPSYGNEFQEVKEADIDPYSATREEVEPAHVIQEINYGRSMGVKGAAPKMKMSPEVKKLIEAEAIKMLPDLLKANPNILKEILTNLSEEVSKDSEKAEEEAEVETTEADEAVETKKTVKKSK